MSGRAQPVNKGLTASQKSVVEMSPLSRLSTESTSVLRNLPGVHALQPNDRVTDISGRVHEGMYEPLNSGKIQTFMREVRCLQLGLLRESLRT